MEPGSLAARRAEFADLATRCAALRAEANQLCLLSEQVRAWVPDLAARTAAVRRPAAPPRPGGRALARRARWANGALGRGRGAPRGGAPGAVGRRWARGPRPMAGGAGAEAILCQFVAATCLGPGGHALDRDEPLLANGILDSLGLLHLTAFIEETFGVAVPDDALTPERFGTLRRIAGLVEHLQTHAPTAPLSGHGIGW